jgi:hypothetical protein
VRSAVSHILGTVTISIYAEAFGATQKLMRSRWVRPGPTSS